MVTARIVLQGTGAWEQRHWDADRRLSIGRLPDSDVLLDDASISRRHAEIVHGAAGWAVRDLGSTNGTFLNGVRLGRIAQPLRLGDHLQPGKIALTIAALVEPSGTGSYLIDEAGPPEALTPGAVTLAGPTQHGESATRSDGPLLPPGHAGEALSRGDPLADLLAGGLDGAVRAVAASAAAVLLVEENTGRLALRAKCRPADPQRGTTCPPALVKACVQQELTIRCDDVRALAGAADDRDGAVRAVMCVPLHGPRRLLGVLCLDRPAGREPFTDRDQLLAEAVATTLAAGIASAQQMIERQRHLFVQTVLTLAQAVDCRDPYTAGHTQRVTDYALLLAEELQVSPADYHHLQIGTPLHDIGKIGIDDAILRKPGRLTPDEFAEIQAHPAKGEALLATIPELAAVLPIVRSHHEHWDGTGYPDGLIGTAIAPLARLVTVADVFDALISDRPYRKALSPGEAFTYVQRNAGTLFDPQYAQAFLRLRPRLEKLLRDRGAVMATISKRELDQLKESLVGTDLPRIRRPGS